MRALDQRRSRRRRFFKCMPASVVARAVTGRGEHGESTSVVSVFAEECVLRWSHECQGPESRPAVLCKRQVKTSSFTNQQKEVNRSV